MRFLRNSEFVVVLGLVLVVLVGFCLVPSFGLAGVEISVEVGVAHGDPCDCLGSGASEGDPVDGLGGPATLLFGDPGNGLAYSGDPDDGIDYLRIYCYLGDFVWDNEVTPFFGYFQVP